MNLKMKTQSGHAITEWTVATFILIMAMFVPWNGEQSAVSMFMDAARTNHANSSYPLSLP